MADPSWGRHLLPREVALLCYQAGWIDAQKLLEAVSVCIAESNAYEHRTNVNKDGSIDRGIWALNDKAFPNISDDVAFNAAKATKMARQIYIGRNNTFSAWAAYNNGQYKDPTRNAMIYAFDGISNMLRLKNGYPIP